MTEDTKPPKQPAPLPTVETVKKRMQEEFAARFAKHMEGFDPDAFAAELTKQMAAQQHAVVLRLMGMDNRWGKWEVDHCNGRKSPITEELEAHCGPIIKKWVIDNTKELLQGELAKVKGEIKKALLHEVREKISWRMRDHTEKLCEELVAEARKELKKELMGDDK